MRAALAAHDEVLRDAIEAQGAWVCDVLGHESARGGTCFVPLEQARGAVVVSVVVVHDSGDETDADPETAEQHRGGDHRPPWVARSGGEQRQR
jgi:hypothetical protein